MDEHLQQLQEAGLSGNEAKVYYELLQREPQPANDVARNLGMDRTLTYQVLNNLVDKGLASYVLKEKKKHFSAAQPEALLNDTKKKLAQIHDLIPQLKELETLKEITNEITVYEGKDGLRNLAELVLPHTEFCSFGATGRLFHLLYEIPRIAKSLGQYGITARTIGPPELKEDEAFQVDGVEYRWLDIESEATTSIFGDYVAIHLIKQKPLLILIHNPIIAQSYKNHFEVLWSIAQQ